MSPRPLEAPPSWPRDHRGRLTATMALIAAERGYAATRVTDVIKRSGISSRTFYVYFENRDACFFSTYDAIVADVDELLALGAAERPGSTLELTLRRLLDHFAAWPAHASILLVEVLSAGPQGIERHEATMAMLAARLADCSSWQPGRCDGLARRDMAQALVGAISRMVQLRLSSAHARTLSSLLPSLMALTTRVGVVG